MLPMISIRTALETALADLGETVPAVNITSSTAGASVLVTTSAPHKLKSGVTVSISGHTGAVPALNGRYIAKVIDATRVTLIHTVSESPIASTANGVGGVLKAHLTAWDNANFNPVPGVPYQKANLVFVEPEDVGYGGLVRESGFLQVSSFYPIGLGTRDVTTRIEALRNLFKRGKTFQQDGITIHIHKTPQVMTGVPIDESYAVPVRIPFYADVFK